MRTDTLGRSRCQQYDFTHFPVVPWVPDIQFYHQWAVTNSYGTDGAVHLIYKFPVCAEEDRQADKQTHVKAG